jgi:hypothetical protein
MASDAFRCRFSVRIRWDAAATRAKGCPREHFPTGDYRRLPAITGDYRRLPAITGDYRRLPAITGDYRRLPAFTGDYQRLPTITTG